MLNEHRSETQTHRAQLQEKIDNLGTEVTKLKRKLEDALSVASPNRPVRIPRSFSVSCLCFTGQLYFTRMQLRPCMMERQSPRSLRDVRGS